MQSNLLTFIPIKEIIPFWPSDKFQIPGLENIGLSKYDLSDTGSGWEVEATVLILTELKVSIPGMDGFAFAVGRGDRFTEFDVQAQMGDGFSAKLKDVDLRLQFSSSFFQPVKQVGKAFVVDKSVKHAEVSGKVSLTVDSQGNTGFEAGKTFGISKPLMIGSTGVIIETMQLAVNLDGKGQKPAGADDNWQGLYIETAVLRIPTVFDGALNVKQFGIGSGGISGTVDYANPQGKNLLGLDAKLTRIGLTFQQNIPTRTSIEGSIKLPFFEDWLSIAVAIGFDGNVLVRLANPKGASKLEIKDVLQFEISALAFASEQGVFTAKLSGKLTPTLQLAGISWPSFDIKELAVASDGKVKLEGGWQELSKAQTIKLAGIRLEVSKVGFGTTEDGRKWFGLNGAVRLVEGVSAGASVDGLKIVWDDSGSTAPQVTFNGIGVDMKIPNVLDLQGAISYADMRFVGKIKLTLYPLDKAKIDAILVVGETDKPPRYTYFAIYLAGEWNTGIPIGPVGLYGMAGLFALNYEPGKKPGEAWYEDPVDQAAAAGWYKRPQPGVTDLPAKWSPELDNQAIGAGVTLGVLPMNGYPFNGRLLLVIVFPGPLILLEGRANLLQERTKLDEDPLFRALAVLDGREATFEFGLDAKYAYDKAGTLIDINGSAHGFFGAPDRWHLYLGRNEPKEKRIRAALFKLFQASAYFMIDNSKLQTGAWLGYAPDPLKFGPVQVVIEAWIDGNAAVNWQPAQFHGDLWLHGKIGIQVFIIRLGLAVDAKLAADVFDPFYIMAMLGIKVEIFPFPPLAVQAKIEWKPEKITWPPLPLPVKEVSVAHTLVSTNWPLPRAASNGCGPLLLPDYQAAMKGFIRSFYVDAEFSKITMPASDRETRRQSPVVPMDARLHISFTQPIHDDILVGNNSRPPAEYIEIGNPDKQGENPLSVRFGLAEISLEKWSGQAWQSKARRWLDGSGKNQSSGEKLFGSWAPVPAVSERTNIEQTKLWLWSETPFDYTRNSGKALEQWYTEKLPHAPCIPVPPKRPSETYTFGLLNRGEPLLSGWSHPENPALRFAWKAPGRLMPLVLSQDLSGYTVVLRFPATDVRAQPNWLTIRLPQNTAEPHYISRVDVLAADQEAVLASGDGTAAVGPGVPMPHPDLGPNNRLFEITVHAFPGKQLRTIELRGGALLSVLSITLVFDITERARNLREIREKRILGAISDWNDVGRILEPDSQYRLKIVTTVQTRGTIHALTEPGKTPEIKRTITEYAYFQTQGPPGLASLAKPVGLSGKSEKDFTAGLDDLAEYVQQTLPPSIPAEGSKRLHPKPHYRAFDVGVEFNAATDYVDLMYQLASRDLMLYLYDNNDRPVRDAQGWLSVAPASWDTRKQTTLLEQQQRFISLLNNCAASSLPPVKLPVQLSATSANRVLASDTAYEARLKPLLLHDALASILPGRWRQPDDTIGSAAHSNWTPSQVAALAVDVQKGEMYLAGRQAWKIRGSGKKVGLDAGIQALRKISALVSEARKKGNGFYTLFLQDDRKAGTKTYLIRRVEAGDKVLLLEDSPVFDGTTRWSIQPGLPCLLQSGNIWGGSATAGAINKPGTILPLAPGADWSDYRFTVTARSLDDDAIGVAFRYQDMKNYYLFAMDRQRRYRRLLRIKDGRWSLLQADDFVFETNRDYAITVEAVANQITVFLDRETVFSHHDRPAGTAQPIPPLFKGTVGLYSWANNGATFRDLSVDDLSKDSIVVYRLPFTTSRFANFAHHMHSYQDVAWYSAVDTKPDWKNAVSIPAAGKQPTVLGLPGNAESISYAALAKKLLGSGFSKTPHRFEVTRLSDAARNKTWALLCRSPEPIDWARTQLALQAGPARRQKTVFAPGAVKLISGTKGTATSADECVDILLRDACNLSHCRVDYLRMPDAATPMTDELLLADSFDDSLTEADSASSPPDALWSGSPEDFFAVAELTDRNGKPLAESSWTVEKNRLLQRGAAAGSMVLIGEKEWLDYQFSADMLLQGSGTSGILLRYRDAGNYYQLGINADNKQWQLIRAYAGVTTLLAQGSISGSTGSPRKLRFRAQGAKLAGYWGRRKLFERHDYSLHGGRSGLFCDSAVRVAFNAIEVNDLSRRLGQWRIHDLGNPKLGPSQWKIAHGALWQRSNIWSLNPTFQQPGLLGTFVTAGDLVWRDYRLTVQMRSDDNDAIGIMVRCSDPGSYYLLVTDQQQNYTRLIKAQNGAFTTLWPASAAIKTSGYTVGKSFGMELEVQGAMISGYIDGQRLFAITDRSLPRGGIGLFAWANTGACFQNVEVRSLPERKTALLTETFKEARRWWQADDDSPAQLSIHGGEAALAENDQLWTGSKKWGDVVCSLRWRMAEGGKAAGLLFRYQDRQNYYRLTLGVEGLSLSRVRNGIAAPLWKSQRKAVAGYYYELLVKVADKKTEQREKLTEIELFLDGIPLCRVLDVDATAIASGAIGCFIGSGTQCFISAVAVIPAANSFNQWLLNEQFDELDPEIWSVHDEVAAREQGSQWSVADNELQQRSNIYGYVPGSRKKQLLGTTIVAGNGNWSDYRFTAEIRSDDDDAIGVLFRYRDAKNHYRLFMDQQRKIRRLVKIDHGEHTVLWEQQAGLPLKTWNLLAVDVFQGRLSAHLNGETLFEISDENFFGSGGIGLFCWANKNARFRNVRVAAARWLPFYIFGKETPFQAGTQIRLHAATGALQPGRASTAPTMLHRYAVQDDADRLPRLRATDETLRIVSVDGSVMHCRMFDEPRPYREQPLRILRNNDGTGFFLLPAADQQVLPNGAYKCRFWYLKNVGEKLPVLRESGSDHTEFAEIDID